MAMPRRKDPPDRARASRKEKSSNVPPPFDPDLSLITERERRLTKDVEREERAPGVPPFDPDLDLIGDMEKGPIFPRDPGAEARRQARKRAAKKD